ncbi:MAG: Ig-like domain-containing protein [Coriobacteriia bacterium]|nr:Ig-like domain-containing protein [Coriobacteriia bacterium]
MKTILSVSRCVSIALSVCLVAACLAPAAASAATVTKLSKTVTGTVVGIVSGSSLNVRSAPSTGAAVIAKIKNGVKINITGYTSDGWLAMNTSAIKLGYVSKQYVKVPVSSVSMTTTAKSVTAGSATATTYSIFPACATNKAVTWTSSNTAAATVSAAGLVSAKAAGSAKITVKTKDGLKTATCVYTVQAASKLALTGVTPVTQTIAPGKALTVAGKVTSNYKITSVTAAIKGTSYTWTDKPNATSYSVSTTMNNKLAFNSLAAGTYTFTLSATDSSNTTKAFASTITVKAQTPTTIVVSTLAISGAGPATQTIAPGKALSVTGKVTSNYKITAVTAAIKTSSGTVKYSYTDKPNATSYIVSSTMDNKMLFNSLDAGTYTYTFTATDGSATKTFTSTITVKAATPPASTLAITGAKTAPPASLVQGGVVTVQGTVTSNYSVVSVQVGITNASGAWLSGYPKSSTVNLSSVDAAITFNTLPVGSYYFKVVARDGSMTSDKVLQNTAFKVVAR